MFTSERVRTSVSALVLFSFLGMTTACYGPFNLTRNVYHFNSNVKGSGEVSEKWMKEIVFFGMIVIPVYMFSALLDAFIFNSLQFWTGDNPIKAGDVGTDGRTRVVRLGETTITMTMLQDGHAWDVIYAKAGRVFQTATIVPVERGYRLVDGRDRVILSADMTSDGGVKLVDREYRVVATLTGTELRTQAERLAALAREPR
jgi:hypothetical protein